MKMHSLTGWIGIILGVLVLAGMGAVPAQAALDDASIPPGFRQVASAPGVQLYRKDYSGGNPDYVQVVDMSQGAKVKLLHGPIQETRPEKGAYGGPDARILSRSLPQFWDAISAKHPATLFCVTNGQFFYMRESPTRLPFSLKVDGEIVSDGYAKNEFPDQKLMLEIWSGQADIGPLSRSALYLSTAPDIVAGLAEDARKSPTKYVARTFVGVADYDQDGQHEAILIFNSKTARQKDAAEVLRSFGAAKVMMLDGGGSTQLTCKGKAVIASERLIPQALAVLSGQPSSPQYEQMEMVSTLGEQPAAAEQPLAAQTQDSDSPPLEVSNVLLAAAAPAVARPAAAVLAAPQVALFKPTDLLLIPGVIGPMAAILLFVLLRWRSSY